VQYILTLLFYFILKSVWNTVANVLATYMKLHD